KKKKRKKVRIYQRGWFTVACLALIATALGYATYSAFFKPPSPLALYETAQKLKDSSDHKDRAEAREAMNRFLANHSDHPNAAEVQQWADAIDMEDCDRAMHKRRNANFATEGNAEPIARDALDYEDLGKLSDARESWDKLTEFKNKKDPNDRAWGLVAEKY